MIVDRRSVLRAGAAAALVAVAGRIPAAASDVPWDQLRARLGGTLVLPSDADYPRAKQLYFAEFDATTPRGVAYCTSASDVSACVRFARAHGFAATPRSGGHSAAGYSSSAGLVVDVSRMNSVRVTGSTVTVGSGLQQVDGLAALAPGGRVLPAGSAPTVGVAGYLQGGGFGMLTRSVGMACDHIVSAEVVLADGSVVHTSARRDPDLHWALRGGGGGNFGIVTAFEVAPVAITGLVNFAVTWPWDAAAAVLTGWQEWVRTGPREAGSGVVVVLPDAAPGAVPFVSVSGAWSGAPDQAAGAVDALVAAVGRAPATRRVAPLSYYDAMMETYGCSTKTVEQCHHLGYSAEAVLARGAYANVRSRMFRAPVPATGIDAVLGAFDAARASGHGRVLSGAALGGRANDVPRTATAYVHRDTLFTLSAVDTLPSGAPSPSDVAAGSSWVDGVYAAFDPYSNGETYQNSVDPSLRDWRRSYYRENLPRLVAVKHHYDPTRFFDFPQAV